MFAMLTIFLLGVLVGVVYLALFDTPPAPKRTRKTAVKVVLYDTGGIRIPT
jgi:hypothetical protein